MKEETKKWLNVAQVDIQKAKDNITLSHYDLASFLCQQSVEKALKAVLIEREGEAPKIHDLVRLGSLVGLGKGLLDKCKKLTLVYLETRYPGISDSSYSKSESEEDIKLAGEVILWANEKISSKN